MKKPPRLGKSVQPSSYDVGYAKPPIEARFRKGQSGNLNRTGFAGGLNF